MGRGLNLASGRVIALGRLLLATLFLTAMWADASQPTEFPREAMILLAAYAALAAAMVMVAWRSWWFDAHLAGPMHAFDIALFTAVVFLTPGDTSPFFIFCIFVLLAAAIRWGWRATALTAVLLTLLYVLAGSATVAASQEFEINRFVTRTAYLIIFSLVLIWFGVNQWRAHVRVATEELLSDPSMDTLPLEGGLQAAMAVTQAERGAFVWSRAPARSATVLVARDGTVTESELAPDSVAPPAPEHSSTTCAMAAPSLETTGAIYVHSLSTITFIPKSPRLSTCGRGSPSPSAVTAGRGRSSLTACAGFPPIISSSAR